ncbi:MAG TPA: glutathione S-transferase family protein [Labilithrix sp.]|nr:glutathione S-transferase family protein [Labilithrix sp.]
MTIVLHGFQMSPNTRRALLALEETGSAYRFEPVDLMTGQQKSEAYRKLNPTARVPTLVDGKVVLWESNAILVYLAAKHPDRLFAGETAAERGEVARWMFMTASHLSPAMARIFAHTIRLPEDQRIPRLVEESRGEVDRSLSAVELHLQGTKREYLVGSFGIADLSLSPTLGFAAMINVSLDAYPAVKAWFSRVQDRPAWKKVYA